MLLRIPEREGLLQTLMKFRPQGRTESGEKESSGKEGARTRGVGWVKCKEESRGCVSCGVGGSYGV